MIKVGMYCKNCKERTIGCHDKCERYLDIKAAYDAETAAIADRKAEENQLISFSVEAYERRHAVYYKSVAHLHNH